MSSFDEGRCRPLFLQSVLHRTTPMLAMGALALLLSACGSEDSGNNSNVDSGTVDTGDGDAVGIDVGDLDTADANTDTAPDTGTDTTPDTRPDVAPDVDTDVAPDTGLCDGPSPAGCASDADCADGDSCESGPDTCYSSSCFCDESIGDWACTDDCGGGICVPSNGTCDRDEQCEFGAEWCIEGACGECDNSAEACDIDCGEGYGLPDPRNGCTPCECVPLNECLSDDDCNGGMQCVAGDTCNDSCAGGDPACCIGNTCEDFCEGDNPAGCSETGCPAGEACFIPAGGCFPSSCFCDWELGTWSCTEDCGGGGECQPIAPGECDTDDDCSVGRVCERGECGDAICDDFYAPVCGVDGRTYGNECEARAAHVAIGYDGECVVLQCDADRPCPPNSVCEDNICVPSEDCPDIYDPVCGINGLTYSNECVARQAGAEVAYAGECRDAGDCTSDDECPDAQICVDNLCIETDCPGEFRPVCGEDGTTYQNACFAGEAGVGVAYNGPCDPAECRTNEDCPVGQICNDGLCFEGGCPDIYRPVCGVDGVTYGNECEAEYAHVDIAYAGECELDPECRTDDECGADQRCVDFICVDAGGCPDTWDPVCGVDGVTYSNRCFAAEAGVAVAYVGECRPDDECRTDDECGDAELCEAGVCVPWECRTNDDCPDRLICDLNTHACSAPCTITCLIPDPVCGTDGVTYTCGEADAHCHGVEVAYDGECRASVPCGEDNDCPVGQVCEDAGECFVPACPRILAPVCGTDGVTYDNDCYARVAHAEVIYDGACQACRGDAMLCRDEMYCDADTCIPTADGTCDGLCRLR